MDMRMPEMDGVQATRFITAEYPAMRVIILTMHREDRYIHDAIQAGAYGYLLKTVEAQELFAAIRIVHHGEALLDPATTLQLLNTIRSGNNNASAVEQNPTEGLTEGEKDVLRLVAQGLDNSEIATQLHLAKNTVANRLRDIYQKIYVTNRTQAALWALRTGLASLNER